MDWNEELGEEVEEEIIEEEKSKNEDGKSSNKDGKKKLKEEKESWISWRRTSFKHLAKAEANMLAKLSTPYKQLAVEVNNCTINTIVIINEAVKDKLPLVLIHGFGAGIGFWIANLDDFAKDRPVYAFDMIGFGRSSRNIEERYSGLKTPEECENFFVEYIEGWCKAVGLDKILLLGHSLGGFLSACYCLKYPSRVKKLILADPWGIPEKPLNDDDRWKNASFKWKLFRWGASVAPSPLGAIRAAGPWGRTIIEKVRPDIPYKFAHIFCPEELEAESKRTKSDEEMDKISFPPPPEVVDYIYHLNAQSPATGEEAFWKMVIPVGWAVRPLSKRLHDIDSKIPISFIYGSDTWMNPGAAYQLKREMVDHDIDIVSVFNSGHHVYIDNWIEFNLNVLRACDCGLNDTKKEIDDDSGCMSED